MAEELKKRLLSMYRGMRLFLMVEEEPLEASFRTMSLSTTGQGRRSTWEDLSPELLEVILRRLTIMDYLKCREICSSWREAVGHALHSIGSCPPKSQLPFLLTLPPSSTDNPATANLLSLTQRKAFHMSTQSWEGPLTKVNMLSVHGWLMVHAAKYQKIVNYRCYMSNMTFSFFNPVSRSMFKLPNLSFLSMWPSHSYTRIDFTSTPHSPEFLMAILISGHGKQWLAFCKVKHGSWTFINTVETRKNKFQDIAVHDDRLYAIATIDFAFIFSLKDPNAITVERLVMLDPKPSRIRAHSYVKGGIRHVIDGVMRTLAVDNTSGELLLVFHVIDRAWQGSPHKCSHWTKEFRVYRLDFSGPRWSEIKHLGDRFLFCDRTRTRVISARGLDGAQEFNGGNCIFFCYANTLRVDPSLNHDVGVFFLTGKSIRRCSFHSAASPAALRDIWFSPNPW